MKVKSYFLRMLLVAALMLPWVAQGQIAKVSEYDFAYSSGTYTSLVNNGGTAWSQSDLTAGYATITMPFAFNFGQTTISRSSTLYVSPKGYVCTDITDPTDGKMIAPLGFTGTPSNITTASIYTKVEGSKVTVEWRKLKYGTNTVTFQLVITNMGLIEFHYGPMTFRGNSNVFFGMQSSDADVYNCQTVNNRWDTIVVNGTSITATRPLTQGVHPLYDALTNIGVVYTFTQPECAKPNRFSRANTSTYNNAIFNWTGSGSKYQIVYAASETAFPPLNPPAGAVLLDNLTGQTTTATGLTQRTHYFAYIRAYCATTSSWGSWLELEFETECGFEELPYTEDFSGDLPKCMSYLSSEPTDNMPDVDFGALKLNAGTSTGYAQTLYAILPQFATATNLNNYELDFTAEPESATQGTLTLGYMTNATDASTFTALQQVTLSSGSEDYVIYLTDLANIPSGARLAFRWTVTSSYYYVNLDDVTVKPQPTCFPISGLAVNVTSGTTATISWTDGHTTSNGYQLAYGPVATFDLATATPVDVNTNPANLTGLEGSTSYVIYARAKCGAERTDWIGPEYFTTPCPATVVTAANPFVEDFNATAMPQCWSQSIIEGTSEWSFASSQAKFSTTSHVNVARLFLPVLDLSAIANPQLVINHMQQNWGTDQDSLIIYYRASGSADWTLLAKYTDAITAMTEDVIALPNPSATYEIALEAYGEYGYGVIVESIKVEKAPNCSKPVDIALNSDGSVTWTAGTTTQWQVRWAAQGSSNFSTPEVVNTPSYTSSSWAGTSAYTIQIRSICGVDDTLDWVSYDFNTPASIPFTCDFENGATGFTLANGTLTNAWSWGTATNNGGTHSLYISNDGGASNSYNTSSYTTVFAYVTLPFTEGDYAISYDWNGKGESSWDFMRVALVPSTEPLIPSTSYSDISSSLPTGWMAVDGGSQLSMASSWQSYNGVVTITTPGVYNLAFIWSNDNSTGTNPPAAVDNVSVTKMNCSAPSNIAGNSTITWTAGNTTQWQVRWAEQGSANYTYATVNTPSYTSTAWTDNTDYTIEIRSICGVDDTLGWYSYNFTTPCLPKDVVTTAYTEDFDSYASGFGNIPNCWTIVNQASSSSSYPQCYVYNSSTYAVSGNCLYFKSSNTTPIYAVLPQFNVNLNALQINFTYKNEGISATNGTLSLGYMTDPTDQSTFVELQSFAQTTTKTPVEHLFSADMIPAGNYYIAFKYTGGTYSNYWFGIDNVSVVKIPTCVKPVNVVASNITSSSADLSWTNTNATDPASWEIMYNGTTTTSTTSSVSLSALNANTNYEVQVRAICVAAAGGAGDTSDWSQVASFRTSCGATQALPYAEDFSGYTGMPTYPYYGPAVTPACWDYYSNGTNTAETSGSSYYGGVAQYSSTSYGCMEANNPYLALIGHPNYTGTTSSYINYVAERGTYKVAVLPTFAENIANLTMSFNYKMSTNYASYGNLLLGYITDNVSDFVTLATYPATSTTQSVELTLGSLIQGTVPNNARIALKWDVIYTTSSYPSAYYCGIDNINVTRTPACISPNQLTVSNVTNHAATLSWNERTTAYTCTSWEVKYSTDANFDPATSVGTTVQVNGTPTTSFSALTAATTYYMAVRSMCAPDDISAWSDVISFTTDCDPIAVTLSQPYVVDFEDGVFPPQCWSTEHISGPGSQLWALNTSSSSSHNSSKSAQLPDMQATTYTNLVAGPFAIDAANGYNVSFWMYRNATGASYALEGVKVWVNTQPTTEGGVELMHAPRCTGIAPVVSSTGWYQFESQIPITGSVYVIFEGISEYGSASYIDDIELSKLPPCIKPSNIASSNVTPNSASFTWQANSLVDEASFSVVYGVSGTIVDPDLEAATTTTTNSITLNGLSEHTTYDVFVRANCGTDGNSEWSNVYTFTTPCNPIAVTMSQPYVVDFEDGVFPPQCWSTEHISGPGSQLWALNTSSSSSHNSNKSAQLPDMKATTYTNLVAGPFAIDAANGYNVSFWMYRNVPGTSKTLEGVKVWVNTQPTTEGGVELMHAPRYTGIAPVVSSTGWYQFESSIPITGSVYVIFEGISEYGNASYIDDIELSKLPPCIKPSNIETTTLLATTATLNWQANSLVPETGCEVVYGLAGTILDPDMETPVLTATNSITLNDLTEQTAYDVFIRANCGSEGYSDWSNVFTFTTPCEVIAITAGSPYTEDFSTYSTMTNPYTAYSGSDYEPSCWDLSTTGTALSGTGYFPHVVNYSNTGSYACMTPYDNYLFMGASSSATYGEKLLVLPRFDQNVNNLSLTFDYKFSNATYGMLEVGYYQNDEFFAVDTAEHDGTNTVSGYNVVMPFTLATSADARLALRYSNSTTTSNYYLGIDNITVVPTPSCIAPNGLVASDITSSTATLTWNERSRVPATKWEVVVGTPGFDPDLQQPIVVTGAHTTAVTGLKHSSVLEWRVRAICDEATGDYSDWSQPAQFNTACDVWNIEDLPLVENFDNVTGNTTSTINGHVSPNCWDYLNTSTTTSATSSTGYPGLPSVYSSNGVTGNALRFYTGNTAAFGNQIAILPQMNFDVDTIDLEFYARKYSASYAANIVVGVMSDPDDASSFVEVATVAPTSTSYQLMKVSLADYQGTGRYVAIKCTKPTSSYAGFYIDDLTMKVREKINYLPGNANYTACNEFFLADTVGHEGNYSGNINSTTVIYPATPGKVLRLTGTLNTELGFDYLSIYEGVGTTGNLLYRGTGNDNIDVQSDSYNWATNGAMTVVFTTDLDNDDQYYGFKLLASCVCPATAPATEDTVTTNQIYTWVNGRTYSNIVDYPNAADKVWDEIYYAKNVAQCDSTVNTLHLTIHPTYKLTKSIEFCTYNAQGQPNTYEWFGHTYSNTGIYTDTLQTVFGADSIGTLNLQVRPAPVAAIYANNRSVTTINGYCDNTELVLTGRSNIENVNFKWEDASTDAIRTVTPHLTNDYILVATEPNYGCASQPVKLTVTTTPVPDPVINATLSVLCAGESTTLTVNDNMGLDNKYRWNTGDTTTSITVSPAQTTTYTVTVTTNNESACAVTAEAIVKVNPLPFVMISASAPEVCRYNEVTLSALQQEGYQYEWTDLGMTGSSVTFTPEATNRYKLLVTDANGCRKNFTTPTITVRPAYVINDTLSACAAMLPIRWGDQTLNQAGDYTQTFPIAYNCDSTVKLNFQVTETGISNSYRELCQGTPFTFGEGIYQRAYVAEQSGLISYTDTTTQTCPVKYNLFLTVNMPTANAFAEDVCDSYVWNGQTYTETGDYNQTLKTTKECDSVVTLNLIVRKSTAGIDQQTPCDKLTWIDGITYTEDNHTATKTITNMAGCDSVVTLNLRLRHKSYGVDDVRYCAAKTYTWINGETYNMSETDGTVTYLLPDVKNIQHCDTIRILNLVLTPALDTLNWVDTTACNMWMIDTMACDGTIGEKQITASGDYILPVPSATAGRFNMGRYHVTINKSTYHTTIVNNVCIPYQWKDSIGNPIQQVLEDDLDNLARTQLSKNFTVAEGCDHTEVLWIYNAKLPEVHDSLVDLCQGASYSVFGNIQQFNEPGLNVFHQTLQTVGDNGCKIDSVLTLMVAPVYSTDTTIQLCESQFVNNAYVYYSTTNPDEDSIELTIPGALNEIPYDNTTFAYWHTVGGCDSTLTINYQVKPTTRSTLNAEAAYTYTWAFNGQNFGVVADTTVTDTILSTLYNCDSIQTLTLSVYDSVYEYVTKHVCNEYEAPDGRWYNVDSTFRTVYPEAVLRGNVVLVDSVVYTSFVVRHRDLTEMYVVSTDPYLWQNGTIYTASVDEVFYNLHNTGGCDSTLVLHFNMVDTIVRCREELPYVTDYGFTIQADAVSGTYHNTNAMGNDTIITYVINESTITSASEVVCDRYVWPSDGKTYTASGIYIHNYENEYKCSSSDTLKLTVFYNMGINVDTAVCESITWKDTTFTTTGTHYYHFVDVNLCPSIDTLNLVVNTNTNSSLTVDACDVYTWVNHGDTVGTYTATTTETHDYFTAAGCASTDTLYLTIGHDHVKDSVLIESSGAYRYTYQGMVITPTGDTLFGIDTLFANNDTTTFGPFTEVHPGVVSPSGCDSIIHILFHVGNTFNKTETFIGCDDFTWNRNGETYLYIDAAEAAAHARYGVPALYKTIDGEYIYERPNFRKQNMGTVDSLYILNLILTKSFQGSDDTTFLLSTDQLVLGDSIFTFAAEKAAKKDTVVNRTVHYANTSYCDSVVNYTINLIYNYDTLYDTICATQTEYVFNGTPYATTMATTAAGYLYELTENIGTGLEMVVTTMELYQYRVLTSTDVVVACDSTNWHGTMFYADNDTMTYVDHRYAQNCDSTITLNLTMHYATHNAESQDVCDAYTWHDIAYTTSGTYTYNYNDGNNCPSTDTLHLTVRYGSFIDTSAVACDSFTWRGNTYTASGDVKDSLINAVGCDSITTLHLTINASKVTDIDSTVCDSWTWADTTATVSGLYTHIFATTKGCDSTVNVNLTVNYGTHNVDSVVSCDNYTWNGMTFTQSCDTVFRYINDDNCASVDTLHLTINVEPTQDIDTNACESYTWVRRGASDTTIYESGIFYNTYTNPTTTCQAVDQLVLTINHLSYGHDTIVSSDGVYIYKGTIYTADRRGGSYFDTVFASTGLVSVNGCDSIHLTYLLVGTAGFDVQNYVECDNFTWTAGNGHTYVYHANKPAGALYYDATDAQYVYLRPQYLYPVRTVNGFDSIALLNLTLTQRYNGEQNTNFLLSQKVWSVSNGVDTKTIDFTGYAAGVVDTTLDWGPSTHYCDSLVTYHINLIDNFTMADTAHVCVTTSAHTWVNPVTTHIKTIALDSIVTSYDHYTEYLMLDTAFVGDKVNEMVYGHLVAIHPLVYTTETRTACGSYTWNDEVFTTDTNVQRIVGPSIYGCDSTVILHLTVFPVPSSSVTDTACDSYTWYGTTYTFSGNYYHTDTTVHGCLYTDTLHLTLNHNTSHREDSVNVCDSYEWHEGVYYTTGDWYFYYMTPEGCLSVDTIYMTIRHNSSHREADVTVCESYTWHDSVYTTSGERTYEYLSAEGCPSVDTLNMTINHNTSHREDSVVACDEYTWHGTTYKTTGEQTYAYNTPEGCASVDTLHITVNYNTGHTDHAVMACQSYQWHDQTITTTGFYYYNYLSEVHQCPSQDTIYVEINYDTTYAVVRVNNHCGPYTWIVNDSVIGTYTESTEASTSIINPKTACDSIIYLKLTVINDYTFYDTAAACDNQLPYVWTVGDDEMELAATDDYHIDYIAQNGCDSIYHMNFTVNPTYKDTLTAQVCLGKGYKGYNFDISADEMPEAGTYYFNQKHLSVAGCDSLVTLVVNVGSLLTFTEEQIACETYTWEKDDQNRLFTESGIYWNSPYLNPDGCKSVDTLKLTIVHNTNTAYVDTACESYTWHDTTYTKSGVYLYNYVALSNCPSTDTLYLTILHNTNTAYVDTACDSYTWMGHTYTQSGDYQHSYTAINGCPSVDTLHLTIKVNSNTGYTQTACDSYEWHGTIYTVSGNPQHQYIAENGCPSVDTLHLTVLYNTSKGETAVSCVSYTWHDSIYFESGNYTYAYNAPNGCPSVDTLHLTVNYPSDSIYNVVACDSYTWPVNGMTYNESGTYTHQYTSASGCPSSDTLYLTVNYNTNSATIDTACDSYTWHDSIYTQSGDYYFNYMTAQSCPSTDTLHLTMNYNTNSESTVTACDSYTWNGSTYTMTGTYTYDYFTEAGCASTDTLHLTIKYNSNKSTTRIACDSYAWMGNEYTESGTYYFNYIAVSGCPSVDTLYLTLNYNTNSAVSETACDAYTWHGTTYTESGSYTYDYYTAQNCPSTDTLHLTINNSTASTNTAFACDTMTWNGILYSATCTYVAYLTNALGCDSVATLNLTIGRSTTETINQTACDSYTWVNGTGLTYTTSGNYVHTSTNVEGCNHTATLNLTILNSTTGTAQVTACDSYTWINGQTYTESTNTPTMVLRNAAGCDSTVTLNLTINYSTYASEDTAVCGSYTWNGQTYTQSGIYTYTTTGANNCDSVTTLALLINGSVSTFGAVTACDSYLWNDYQYFESGIYTQTLEAANGCDSVVTLSITINNSTAHTDSVTACDQYTWIDGYTYTQSGIYYQQTINAFGCNHLNTLVLTVNYSDTLTTSAASCDSYVWHEDTIYTSGTYYYVTENQFGCDSINVLELTINKSFYDVAIAEQCDSYTWDVNGQTYTESGVYEISNQTIAGCDSIYTLYLTINKSTEATDTLVLSNAVWPYNYNGYVFEDFGDYVISITNAAGCDSTIYLTLQHNTGINQVDLTEVRTYPNPTTGKITISAENVLKVEVIDFVGRKVAEFENTNKIDLTEFATGTYALRITLPEGTTIRKVVKR